MKPLINKTGITIKELKKLIKDLPEVNSCGENNELWVESTINPNLSSPARTIMKLNEGDLIVSN